MGFGILFLAHIFLFVCKGVDIFPDCLPYLLFWISMRRLSPYNPAFRKARIVALPLAAAAAVSDVFQILAAADVMEIELPQRILMLLVSCGMLALYWFTLHGIMGLSAEVGLKDISDKAKRNLILTVIYAVCIVIYQCDFEFLREISMYFGIFFLLFGLVWVILNGTLIFSCYMWICPEGDEDMSKPSKFLPKKRPPKKSNRDGGKDENADKKSK